MTSSQNRHIFKHANTQFSWHRRELRTFSESAESLRLRPILLEAYPICPLGEAAAPIMMSQSFQPEGPAQSLFLSVLSLESDKSCPFLQN